MKAPQRRILGRHPSDCRRSFDENVDGDPIFLVCAAVHRHTASDVFFAMLGDDDGGFEVCFAGGSLLSVEDFDIRCIDC